MTSPRIPSQYISPSERAGAPAVVAPPTGSGTVGHRGQAITKRAPGGLCEVPEYQPAVQQCAVEVTSEVLNPCLRPRCAGQHPTRCASDQSPTKHQAGPARSTQLCVRQWHCHHPDRGSKSRGRTMWPSQGTSLLLVPTECPFTSTCTRVHSSAGQGNNIHNAT